jgi:hypothetical protein
MGNKRYFCRFRKKETYLKSKSGISSCIIVLAMYPSLVVGVCPIKYIVLKERNNEEL